MIPVFNLKQKKGRLAFEEYLLRQRSFQWDLQKIQTVEEICETIRRWGDRALCEYTRKFDCVEMTARRIAVSKRELVAAEKKVSKRFMRTVERTARRIEEFHANQLGASFRMSASHGSWTGEIIRAIEKVGLYVPGGRAPLVSTILMTAIPARLAGCPRVQVCTPPSPAGEIKAEILATCRFLGVNEVYRVGGAQAIAAMAFGTRTIPAVDFIAGPGNAYVTIAKKILFGIVGIDSLAGPTEIVVIADKTANPESIAVDMLAQAEHDPDCMALLLTPSRALASGVQNELMRRSGSCKRKKIISEALKSHGGLVVTSNMNEAIRISNEQAPEHLEIHTRNPEKILNDIQHAGTVFLGEYSPVPAGDYGAGPNHVLPTNRAARFASPLSVRHFQKYINVVSLNREALKKQSKDFIALARMEHLDAHRKAVEIRLKKRTSTRSK